MSVEAPSAKAIFLEAVGRYGPHEWPRYLNDACAGDEALRHYRAERTPLRPGGARVDLNRARWDGSRD